MLVRSVLFSGAGLACGVSSKMALMIVTHAPATVACPEGHAGCAGDASGKTCFLPG